MNRIAEFDKVTFKTFKKDWEERFGVAPLNLKEIYDEIEYPRRATKGSAGYDFFSPINFALLAGQSVVIPTGIRCKIDEGYMLQIFPRSGLGFKYRLQLANTVGIIDSDYFFADNEGHILIKLVNATKENRIVEIKKGQGFAQGIFIPYGITVDDNAETLRFSGFGSTD